MAPISDGETKAAGSDEAGVATLVQRPVATWGLGRISHKLKGFYNYIYDDSGCAGTRIYIIDTGIRTTHEQFRGTYTWNRRAVFGANFIAGSPVSSSILSLPYFSTNDLIEH